MNVRSFALAVVFTATLVLPLAGCGGSGTSDKGPTTSAPIDPSLKPATRTAGGGAGAPGGTKSAAPMTKD